MSDKHFPNGFLSWAETHHVIVAHLAQTEDNEGSISETAREQDGVGAVWQIGIALTDQFEALHAGRQWDGDWEEAIEAFLEQAESDNQEQNNEPPLCGSCNGSGEGMWDGSSCRVCRGQGVLVNH